MNRATSILAAAVSVCALTAACGKANQQQDKGKTPPAASGDAAAGEAPRKGGGEITVAAASDLTGAFSDVGKMYEAKTGTKVVFKFGSTGQLAKQIEEGAPYDVFAAANVAYADETVDKGACDGASKFLYARGKLVIWSKKGTVAPAKSLEDLADKRFVKIAIANPEHAPYGMAAKQALEAAGLWKTVEPKLVYGENIKQTMQFVETGNAEAGFIAVALTFGQEGEVTEIDEKLYKPLNQAVVACKGPGDAGAARDFIAFLGSPEVIQVLGKYGFARPAEVPPAK